MSALAGYTGGNAGVDRPNTDQAGAASTAATSFGGTVMDWPDLPAESQQFDDGTGTFVTGLLSVGSGYARKINGLPHQEMNGFHAYQDRLVLVTAVRPLVKQPNGTMKPAGPWIHHEGHVLRPAQPPVRTRGSVPPGNPAQAKAEAAAGGAKVPAPQRRGADTYTYLPAPVRNTATKAVPTPSVFLGQLLQWSGDNDLPTRHRISVLRMDEHRAVVILAERGHAEVERSAEQLAAMDWEVTQITYDLDTTATQVAGRRTDQQLPGGSR